MNKDAKQHTLPTAAPSMTDDRLQQEFEQYQHLMENTVSKLSAQITDLEQKLNVFTNLLEISQYINRYIKNQDLFPLINDMLIGVFGAKYSTIYIKTGREYVSVTPKDFSYPLIDQEKALIQTYKEAQFIINSDVPIYDTTNPKVAVYSCLGVPIKLNDKPIGFIIIQHQQKDYFSAQHATFLSYLGNHVGIAIENNILYNQIKESASKDGLTNIFNKTYFFDTINAMPDIEKLNYSVAMIDIDNFKNVNDTYGHPYGDEVLKTIASIIKNSIRPTDIVARYGGEEIVIFFNNFVDPVLVFNRLDQLRAKIANTKIPGNHFSSSVTASFGCYIKKDHILTLNEAIELADENLYICKRTGKNKVILNNI